MKWIGLTGGLASGKSTVAAILRSRGHAVIDADEIAREVVAPGTPGLLSVVAEFGASLLAADGSLDRRELGRRVFGRVDELLRLENLLHPLIQAEVAARRSRFRAQGFGLAFYDVPLLYEKSISGFDAVVVVWAPADVRIERMRARNGWSEDEIASRMSAQLSLEDKAARADFVVRNDGDRAALERAVDGVLGGIAELPGR